MSINKPTKIIVHHSGGVDSNPLQDSSNYSVAQCDADHKARFGMQSRTGHWAGYHYIITKNGSVTQTRFDDEEGAHTIGQNTSSLGILICGNFDVTLPTTAQIEALKTLLQAKMKEYKILPTNIVPHRKFSSKTCYGMKLSDDWAQNLVARSKADIKKEIINLLNQL